MAGEFTHAEIVSQPEAWRSALTELRSVRADIEGMNPEGFDQVVFTGCGSTYYLALAAASLVEELTGVSAHGVPGSEAWLRPAAVFGGAKRTLLVAVSRSGTTTETVRAVERFKREGRGLVLSFTCYPEGDLASLADLGVVLAAGQERSIAQTRAFTVLHLATTFAAHVWAGRPTEPLDALPTACERVLSGSTELAGRLGRDSGLDRFYFLGSGARYGLACEASLKMKEMTLSHSEPFHALEFRHGPQSMVTGSTLMVGLVGGEHEAKERAVLEEMRERGAKVLTVADENADVTLSSGVPESYRNAAYLPALQLLAFERSLHKGLDPDRPHNLQAVVKLD